MNLLLKKERIIKLVLLLIIFIITPIFSTITINSVNNEDLKLYNEQENSDLIKLSQGIGEDPWWDVSWKYRQSINITNKYDDNLNNYGIMFEFNHTNITSTNKAQADLDDLRIIQNGTFIKYYYTIEGDIARVWFESNVGADSSNYNTYMYYGNPTATRESTYFDEDRFGMAWYDFEHPGSSTARDLFGKNDGSIASVGANVQYTTGYRGDWALDFANTQTSAYINVPNTVLYGSSEFTICFWATEGQSGEYIISGSDGSDHNDMIMASPTQIGWHFYVWLRNASGGHIYRDLHLDDSLIWSYPNGNPDDPIDIAPGGLIIAQEQDSLGGGFDANQAFSGNIDDLRFFNYDLSWRELYWLYHNYNLNISLMGEQERAASVRIVVRDIDGRPVPNAEVSLVNNTAPIANRTIVTFNASDIGVVNFEDIPFGEYNVTVNYTLNQGGMIYENVLYDSAELEDATLNFFGLFCNETIYVDIWSIDFEVDDWEGDPMDYGYVLVYNNSNSDPLLANLTLGTGTGINTFRWLNRSQYYYELYYYNKDYLTKQNLLESDTIYRESKLNSTTFFVNQTAELSGGSVYRSSVNIYAENSSTSDIGKSKIIAVDINIELEEIITHLVSLDVQYLASDNTWKIVEEGSKIYGTSETSDTIHLNIIDKYEAYGIRTIVNFFNATQSNGIITINFNETSQVYEKAQMSKLRIYTFDKSSENQPIQYMIVKVVNSTGYNIANLVTDSYGEAKGYYNDVPFWYFHGDYNFSLSFYGSNKSFLVSQSDKYYDPGKEYYDLDPYNYTLDSTSVLKFNVTINIEDYQSRFQDTLGISEVNWGDMMYFEVNYTIKTPILDWTPIQNPTYVRYEIYKLGTSIVVRSGDMAPGDNGNYSLQLNSDVLIGSEWYKMRIFGRKIGYIDPYDVNFDFRVIGVNTGILLHDYNTKDIIISNRTSEYFTQSINITLSYFVAGEPSNRISGATLTYNIAGLSGVSGLIDEEPSSTGYYTFLFDTLIVSNVGQYLIEITADKDNYTKIDDYEIILDIEPIPTTLNGESRVKIIDDVPVLSEQNYTFEYYDTINDARITDCETKYYEWNKLDDEGNFLHGVGNEGVGFLIETVDDLYTLDFDTETRETATYSIAVYLEKSNYLIKFADLTITIVPRPIDDDLIGFPSRQLNLKQGVNVVIQLNIVDKITALPLTDVNVTLTIIGYNPVIATYMGGGIYQLVFSTNGIDTFFTPKSLSAEIIIEKENYETKNWVFNIVVGMTEIFPGFPLFYFLMIIIGVGAVAGAIAGYRFIQLAKIPEFVKKAKSMKKEIKGRNTISEKNLYPVKEEFIAKKYGDDWNVLGLSLKDILGVSQKKGKKLPDTINKTDENGGVD